MSLDEVDWHGNCLRTTGRVHDFVLLQGKNLLTLSSATAFARKNVLGMVND
jgi:hypothetical protein